MGNQAKRSSESAPVLERHGERGMVPLRVEVRPSVKDALIDIAETRGTTIKSVCGEAFDDFIVAASPKKRHRGLLRHRRRAS